MACLKASEFIETIDKTGYNQSEGISFLFVCLFAAVVVFVCLLAML